MIQNWIFCLFYKKNVINFLLKTFSNKHLYCFLSSCVNSISRKISAFELWLEMFSTSKIAGFGTIYLIAKHKKIFRRSIIFREVAGHHFCFNFNVRGSFATSHLLFQVILSKLQQETWYYFKLLFSQHRRSAGIERYIEMVMVMDNRAVLVFYHFL